MIHADETCDGTWPWPARDFGGCGLKQHSLDEGSAASGETFVLGHGEPTWGYLYRHSVSPLSAQGRVVVSEHMGLGKSEMPQGRDDWAQGHVENSESLLDVIDVQDATLVMQDWGGTIGSQFALVFDEQFDDVILNLRFTALSVLQRIGFQRTEIINDTWVRAYSAPLLTAEEGKGARQLPLSDSLPLYL